jgi:hypothetical protein
MSSYRQDLRRLCRERGWTMRPRGGHIELTKEGVKGSIVTSFSPSDRRTLHHVLAQIKRAERFGFVCHKRGPVPPSEQEAP